MLTVVVFEGLTFFVTLCCSDHVYISVLTGIELYRRQKAIKTMGRSQHDGPPLHLFVLARWTLVRQGYPSNEASRLIHLRPRVYGKVEGAVARVKNRTESLCDNCRCDVTSIESS